jgi:hypothetical protein
LTGNRKKLARDEIEQVLKMKFVAIVFLARLRLPLDNLDLPCFFLFLLTRDFKNLLDYIDVFG